MRFVCTKDLKEGMRLARPIFNQEGNCVYDRNFKLAEQGIEMVQELGLLGLYILEPAEPLPPMTEEDLAFERFQTVVSFSIYEELENILRTKSQSKTLNIAGMIIDEFGHVDKKRNFTQDLRSREDYVCRHSLNVAILCTMLTRVLNVRPEEQMTIVSAALVHDVGKMTLAGEIVDGDDLNLQKRLYLNKAETGAYGLIEEAFGEGKTIRRICMQANTLLGELWGGKAGNAKLVLGARILAVADKYDELTAMKSGKAAMSGVKALRYLLEHPDVFDPEVVDALTKSINILVPGVSVELNTGEKVMVLAANEQDVLRPTVLSFIDNTVIDLSDKILYDDLEIVDVMKTLDNRYAFDKETKSS